MITRLARVAGVAGVAVLATAAVTAAPASAHPNANAYIEHKLVSDLKSEHADITDDSLQNPWGLAQAPQGTPAWVANNGTNVATLYQGAAGAPGRFAKRPLTVSIPGDGPTGQVFNPTPGFVVTDGKGNSGPALFIFDSESGDVTGWNPNVPPPMFSTQAFVGKHVDGAIYKGLALATVGTNTFLYAANFHQGTVDVFDSTFTPTKLSGSFTDPHLPNNFAPFGIASLNGMIYVSYAQQDADKKDEVDGFGRGFVDIFDTSGNFVKRLVTRGHLDAPWGMAMAPSGFGKFSGDLLVGNFGNGRIHAYDATTGQFKGTVKDVHQNPIVIPGLWGLMFGNGTSAGTKTLLFSAGIDHEAHGLFGQITFANV